MELKKHIFVTVNDVGVAEQLYVRICDENILHKWS